MKMKNRKKKVVGTIDIETCSNCPSFEEPSITLLSFHDGISVPKAKALVEKLSLKNVIVVNENNTVTTK